MTTASPFSTTAIALLVVPRSMPMSMVPLSDKSHSCSGARSGGPTTMT
jgi:hypothetical protein